MNKNRIIIVALLMLIICCNFIYASDVSNVIEAGNKLKTLGLYKGYKDGSLKLDNNITRAEFATLAMRLICGKTNGDSSKTFTDIDSHWAKSSIKAATSAGLLKGYPDGSFKPNSKISNGEVLTVLVRLLGYDSSLDTNKKWPENYMSKSQALNISNSSTNASVMSTRGNVAVFIDKCLSIKMKKAY
ncbi:S-layer homology domain-containing protein [Clostridiaceae bacterium M8S5]|nr:S-layer homology domain-containing protein [Clostridiaceae bacterium M8S5]